MLRESILARKPQPQPLYVPEWETTVFVRPLSGTERMAWADGNAERKAAGLGPIRNLTALAMVCVCDEAGGPVFQPGDEAAIEALVGTAVERVFEAAARANGLNKEAAEATEKK
jgi:hypothetical protein